MSEESGAGISGSILGNSFSVNGIKRIAELIAVLSLVIMVGMGIVLWTHTYDAKASGQALAKELQKNRDEREKNTQDLKDALKEQARQTKLQTCVIYLSLPEEAKNRIGFSKRAELCQ